MKGLKSVLFITGVCADRCYYCPLSPWRKGKDDIYINEVLIEKLSDAELEIIASGSKGVGITGGDPIIVLNRSIQYINELKDFFGEEFHIHLYTTGTLLNDEKLKALAKSGLDELRIHIIGDSSWVALSKAIKAGINVGIENPVIPNEIERLKNMVFRASKIGVEFINLNELEVSDGNYLQLRALGMTFKREAPAVIGSEETALELLKWVESESIDISVHYCPTRFKDKYQFKRRLTIRGLRTRLPYEEVTEGLVRWAAVEAGFENKSLIDSIAKDLMIRKDNEYLARPDFIRKLKCSFYVVEAFPTTPRREINRFHFQVP
jgi:hypothetical protein